MSKELLTRLRATVAGGDPDAVATVAEEVRVADGFLFSQVQDLLSALRPAPAVQSGSRAARLRQALTPERAAASLEARVASLAHWETEGNRTIAALRAGTLDPTTIRPHIRGPASDNADFYTRQNAALEQRLRQTMPRTDSDPRPFLPVARAPNFNHAFRVPQVVTLVELLFGFLDAMGVDGPLSWLDIACGRGEIANGANPSRFSTREWEIVGADLQQAKIEIARRGNTVGREFKSADALELMKQKASEGVQYHIVSMFEFLEHLDDPLNILLRIAQMQPIFVIAGSPLAQKLFAPTETTPDAVHLWSYSREGWEHLFGLAGLQTVYSAESRIGTYVGGLDWLTIICGPLDWLRANRTELPLKRGES